MRITRTLRTHRPSYSAAERTLELKAPAAWGELSQEQLRYVLHLLATSDGDLVRVKTYMLCRFTGLLIGRSVTRKADGRVVRMFTCRFRTAWWRRGHTFFLQPWQVQSLLHQFDFIDRFDGMDVRLEDMSGCRAVDDELHGYPFGDYLAAELHYQLALSSEDTEAKARQMKQLACCLYQDREGRHPEQMQLSEAEQLGTLMWFAHVKSLFAERFPHFFRRTDGADMGEVDLMGARNAQIRALTEGDITKEARVMAMDCWRALTELDQKAREANEFKQKYGNK